MGHIHCLNYLDGSPTATSMMLRIDDVWTCTECGYNRKQKSHVKEHVESVHLKVLVKCPICHKTCLKSGMRSHRRTHMTEAKAAGNAL